jgi:hypothetical protein
MNYAVEMASDGAIYIQNLTKIGSAIQLKLRLLPQ